MNNIEYKTIDSYIEYYKFLQKKPGLKTSQLEKLDERQLELIVAANNSYNFDVFCKKIIYRHKEEKSWKKDL